MPLLSSATVSESPQSAGRPTTYTAPRIAPGTEPRPPMTTIATTCSEICGPNVVVPTWMSSPASRPPASAAMPPPSANAVSFATVGDTANGRRCRLVVAHGDERAPDARGAQPRHHHRAHHQHREAQVVVGALGVQVEHAEQLGRAA